MSMLGDHQYIVSLLDFFEDDKGFYIVMDYMEGGDLFKRIAKLRNYSERDARELSRKIIEGVHYFHQRNIAHRDLKPNNLLLRESSNDNDQHVEIADFGLATFVSGPESLNKRCGTMCFCAPEIIRGLPYDERADMWSVGVIIYILLGGKFPFIGRRLVQRIVSGNYSFPEKYWAHVSDEAKDLINNLLVVDPNERYTSRMALDSSWFRMENNDALANNLMASVEQLENFDREMARLKFIAAINTLIFVDRLQRNITESKDNSLIANQSCQCVIQ